MQMNKYTIEDFRNFMGDCIHLNFIKWLENRGFFTAPASTKYHGSYNGGLFDHSMEVAKSLVKLTEDNSLKWQRLISPGIVGMFHDLCKIDSYVQTESGYEYNTNILIPGHGEKSVQLLAQHMQLTEEEILCIRWHMGAFDEKNNWNYYSRAVEKCPNVLWTHTADMIASKVVGV